jgi:hypothetical protein
MRKNWEKLSFAFHALVRALTSRVPAGIFMLELETHWRPIA